MDDRLKTLAYARWLFGDLLVVRGYAEASNTEQQIIDAHLADIAYLPSALVARVVAAGLQRIVIGAGALPELADFSRLGDTAGLANGTGIYDRTQRIIVLSTRGSDPLAAHDLLHEFGHAVGHLLDLNNHPVLVAHHQDIEVWMRLPAYFRGIRPGDERGRRELLAEAIRDRILRDTSAPRRYGRSFIRWLNEELELG